MTFVFLGQCFAFGFPTITIAQAIAGTFVSLFFLLAGLFAPFPQLPAGWVWFYRINPIAYGLNALVTPQFYCAGANCPTISLPTGQVVPLYTYLAAYFGLDYAWRWIVSVCHSVSARSCLERVAVAQSTLLHSPVESVE